MAPLSTNHMSAHAWTITVASMNGSQLPLQSNKTDSETLRGTCHCTSSTQAHTCQEDHVQRLNQVKPMIDGEPTTASFLIDDLEYQVLVHWRFQKNGTKRNRKHSFAFAEEIAPSAPSPHDGFALSNAGPTSSSAQTFHLQSSPTLVWHPASQFLSARRTSTPCFNMRPWKYTALGTLQPFHACRPFHPSGRLHGLARCRHPAERSQICSSLKIRLLLQISPQSAMPIGSNGIGSNQLQSELLHACSEPGRLSSKNLQL